jgi:hypothetical protein
MAKCYLVFEDDGDVVKVGLAVGRPSSKQTCAQKICRGMYRKLQEVLTPTRRKAKHA